MKIPRLKRILNQLEPHGPGNMKPVFMTRNVFSTDVRLLKEEHLKISMTQPNSDIVLEGIGFKMADKMDLVAAGVPFDVLYTLETNAYGNVVESAVTSGQSLANYDALNVPFQFQCPNRRQPSRKMNHF